MKLKTRLSLIFGTVVLVIVATIGIVTYNKNVEMGTADAKKTMQISAELAAKEIEEKLSDFKNMAQVSGYDSVLASSRQDDVVADHIDHLAENYEFTSGNILDVNGVSRKDGTDFSDRDYVKEALAGNVNISDLTLSKYTGNYGFSVASPVYEKNGEINGVVYFRMDVDFMSKILGQIVISEGSYTYLVDGNGMVIVHPDESLIGEYNITDAENGMGSVSDMILSQTSGAGAYDNNGTEYLCGYSPVAGTNGWTIVENSEQISKAFKDISVDMKEQADKSSHIKLEISNISEVVQVNSATAEETAAATEELSEQAKNLSQLISRFRV